jgi:hypothetical protein
MSFCFCGQKPHAYCRLYRLSQLATPGERELNIDVRSVSESNFLYAGFEVLTAVTITRTVLRNVTPYSPVEICQH